ncbi:MAG: hypothetical protein ACI808_003102 [Paraglaciecola sp.]|jgi:hypothetical protein
MKFHDTYKGRSFQRSTQPKAESRWAFTADSAILTFQLVSVTIPKWLGVSVHTPSLFELTLTSQTAP